LESHHDKILLLKTSHQWVCIRAKRGINMQEKTLELLKQDILTYWRDLKESDFEDKEFLKELNACVGYYNEYKRGQSVKTTEK